MESRSCRRRAGGKQQSTGLLQLIGSNPNHANKKTTPEGWFSYWRRWRDLNPRTPFGA